MTKTLSAFRLGDVRGVYPTEIDPAFAHEFAHGFIHQFEIKGTVAIGRDMRLSSLPLQEALQEGFLESGINVVDLGLCATELGYFASSMADISAVIIITASHNAEKYNGFKCVLNGGRGINFDNGLKDVMQLMLLGHRNPLKKRGEMSQRNCQQQYIEFLKQRFDLSTLAVGNIALNGLNGTASTLAADLVKAFNLPVTWFRKEPGPIPEEGADPVNPALRMQMFDFMQSAEFSLGVAWDGDCDRCVFFDGAGRHVPAYYMVGFLAEHLLRQHGGGAVVYDTKVCWNILDVIRNNNGIPIPSETGHAFMKRNMRKSKAVYGGELSSHHYFGDFFGCDSGMYAWLKAAEFINHQDLPIEELVFRRREKFKSTPELSLSLTDVDRAFADLLAHYGKQANEIDQLDGLGFDMPDDWRFSIKRSKTEPVIRLNFETSTNAVKLLEKSSGVLKFLQPFQDGSDDWFDRLEIQ